MDWFASGSRLWRWLPYDDNFLSFLYACGVWYGKNVWSLTLCEFRGYQVTLSLLCVPLLWLCSITNYMPFGNGPFVAIPRTIRIGVILHAGYVLVFKYLGASNPQLHRSENTGCQMDYINSRNCHKKIQLMCRINLNFKGSEMHLFFWFDFL